MDLFVEKPINRSKLEAILDQLQGQLSMQSTECSASETEILEPLEPCNTQQDPASALCSEPALVTDSTVNFPGHLLIILHRGAPPLAAAPCVSSWDAGGAMCPLWQRFCCGLLKAGLRTLQAGV
jgi:hypothetical protein